MEPTEKEIKKERDKARKLRKTQWWRNRLNTAICHYCGKVFPLEKLTMDHVVPLTCGGKSTKGNLVVSCKNCNNRKSYHIPAENILKDRI